jgi:hypothetical protein
MTPKSKISKLDESCLKSEIRDIKLDSMSVEIAEDRMRDSAGPRKSAPLRRTLAILLSMLEAGPGCYMGIPGLNRWRARCISRGCFSGY